MRFFICVLFCSLDLQRFSEFALPYLILCFGRFFCSKERGRHREVE